MRSIRALTGADGHAPRWCKSLNPSELTHRLHGNDAFFHRLFHSFCGFPPDGPNRPLRPATIQDVEQPAATDTVHVPCKQVARNEPLATMFGAANAARKTDAEALRRAGRREVPHKGRDTQRDAAINSLSTDGRMPACPHPQACSCVSDKTTVAAVCPRGLIGSPRRSNGAESCRSASARSHQTEPKLMNGPPSIEMRVRTW